MAEDESTETRDNKLARLNPATWSKKTKIIAAGAALALVLAGVGGGFAYNQYAIARDCTVQSELFADQKADLDKAVKDARAALDTVMAPEKSGEEDKRLAHTDDFELSADGQKAINALGKTINAVTAHDDDTAPQCQSRDDLTALTALTDARAADLEALKAQTKTFTETVDKYRLDKAAEEAKTSMDKAKSDLAAAQKGATDQLAVVDGDTALQGDTTVKAAYDALKQTEADSHSASTTVTTGTYDEAVASIEKAKAVEQKAAEVTASVASLQEAITAYQDAKAASASNASTTPETSNDNAPSYGYSGGNNSGSNYSGGSAYTPPAPPANNSGSSLDGRITSGPGGTGPSGQTGPAGRDDPDRAHGCIIIEGQTICH